MVVTDTIPLGRRRRLPWDSPAGGRAGRDHAPHQLDESSGSLYVTEVIAAYAAPTLASPRRIL
jgi:hypothetical protein